MMTFTEWGLAYKHSKHNKNFTYIEQFHAHIDTPKDIWLLKARFNLNILIIDSYFRSSIMILHNLSTRKHI